MFLGFYGCIVPAGLKVIKDLNGFNAGAAGQPRNIEIRNQKQKITIIFFDFLILESSFGTKFVIILIGDEKNNSSPDALWHEI